MKILYSTLIIITAFWMFSCSPKSPKKEKLIIFHAGSFSYPIKILVEKYSETHPDMEIFSEAGGSMASARKITELGRNCDIFISSDYQVIDDLLIPEYASWNLHFATNQICLAYTESSKASETIDDKNWFKIVSNPEIRTGRADPASDPCGYRTVLLFQLAEKYYHLNQFTDQMSKKDVAFIRPKEVDLLALLETQSIDYIFIYRSVAVQHHLKFIELPDSINLGNPAFNDFYKLAKTSIPGKSPDQQTIIQGESIAYSLTIPKNAQNPERAANFINFMIGIQGSIIVDSLGQEMLIPPVVTGSENLPKSIQKQIDQSIHETQ